MQNLQSAAIPSSLTDDQLNILEQAYNDAGTRKPQIESFRESDRTALATLLAANNITGSQATTITNLANGLVDDYKNGISAQLAALTVSDTVKTNIKKLTDSINSLSNDIRLTLQFINWYSSKRPNICLTTDTKNDQYVKGSITFKYDTTRAAVVESCSGNTLSEHFCSGLEYTADATHDKTRTCEFSCNDGACTKGSLGAVSIVNGGTNTATTMTDVKTNQQFWLKVPASRLHRARATSNTNGTVATVVSTGMGYTSAPTVTVSGGTCTTRPTGRATVVDGYVTEVKLIGAVGCT